MRLYGCSGADMQGSTVHGRRNRPWASGQCSLRQAGCLVCALTMLQTSSCDDITPARKLQHSTSGLTGQVAGHEVRAVGAQELGAVGAVLQGKNSKRGSTQRSAEGTSKPQQGMGAVGCAGRQAARPPGEQLRPTQTAIARVQLPGAQSDLAAAMAGRMAAEHRWFKRIRLRSGWIAPAAAAHAAARSGAVAPQLVIQIGQNTGNGRVPGLLASTVNKIASRAPQDLNSPTGWRQRKTSWGQPSWWWPASGCPSAAAATPAQTKGMTGCTDRQGSITCGGGLAPARASRLARAVPRSRSHRAQPGCRCLPWCRPWCQPADQRPRININRGEQPGRRHGAVPALPAPGARKGGGSGGTQGGPRALPAPWSCRRKWRSP